MRKDQNVEKSRHKNKNRPKDAAFLQQNLSAYQPILTVGTSIPYLIPMIIIYLTFGWICVDYQKNIVEYRYDYTDCLDHSTGEHCATISDQNLALPHKNRTDCQCHLKISLDKSIPKDVFIYYSLDGFFQNYRPYVSSLDYFQFSGLKLFCDKNDDNNDLFLDDDDDNNFDDSLRSPCGSAANSLTNKTWKSSPLFRNPSPTISNKSCEIFNDTNSRLKCIFENTQKPKNWPKPIYELDLDHQDNNGFENEDLIVWLRPAAFPSFRKIYGRIDHRANNNMLNDGLRKGSYLIKINYSYPVHMFGGRKSIILSNTSFLGCRNYFLCFCSISLSIILTLMMIIFYFLDKKYGQISLQMYQYIRNYTEEDNRDGMRRR
ncbi:Cell cycle control protein 50A [Sarcoptes scabiei]|uniref:Cell cycle control protein 50A n=1 Tax=Sarcoptes scabiei TaxID=52283 RepID=A0A834RDY3_SARSC|nr:Cell cycle control protein 50A [Sarcoptes scabiei]